MPYSIRLHRVLTTTPDGFRAFLKADALAKWLPPSLANLALLVEPNIAS